MLNSILDFLVNIYAAFIGVIDYYILGPTFTLINNVFPFLGDMSGSINIFLSDYLYKGVRFARDVFLGVTGLPRTLWLSLLIFILAKFNIMVILYGVKAIINAWSLFRTGKSIQKSIG